jgi:hypothetical protein
MRLFTCATLFFVLCGCKAPHHRGQATATGENGYTHFLSISKWARQLRGEGYAALEREQKLVPEWKLFISNLEALGCRLETTIGFVDQSYFVKKYAGQRRKSSLSTLPSTLLFVTDSIPELSGQALVFLSSTRPNHMSILSIDHDLRCTLIYDVSCKNDLLRAQDTALDAVGDVEWISECEFVLRERPIPSMNRAAFSPRTFQLSIIPGAGFTLKER